MAQRKHAVAPEGNVCYHVLRIYSSVDMGVRANIQHAVKSGILRSVDFIQIPQAFSY